MYSFFFFFYCWLKSNNTTKTVVLCNRFGVKSVLIISGEYIHKTSASKMRRGQPRGARLLEWKSSKRKLVEPSRWTESQCVQLRRHGHVILDVAVLTAASRAQRQFINADMSDNNQPIRCASLRLFLALSLTSRRDEPPHNSPTELGSCRRQGKRQQRPKHDAISSFHYSK